MSDKRGTNFHTKGHLKLVHADMAENSISREIPQVSFIVYFFSVYPPRLILAAILSLPLVGIALIILFVQEGSGGGLDHHSHSSLGCNTACHGLGDDRWRRNSL